MKKKANDPLNPFVLSGSSPPNACSANTGHVTSQGDWMTAEEAACYLRVSVKTLYNYKCKGKIVGQNRGGMRKGGLLFRKHTLDLFIAGKRG